MTTTIRISIALALVAASTGAASGSTTASPAAAGAADTVDVVGWPLPDLQAPAPRLDAGDDPIYGRQACPPLTRLNLAQRKSEELLLKKVVVEFSDASRGSVWRLELRPGLFWWSGAPVTADDAAKYVKTVLP